MFWILQEKLFKEEEWINMVNALERLDQSFSVHKVVPFSGELIPPAVIPDGEKKVICFGAYSMRHTAAAMGWDPGVYDLYNMDFKVQLSKWGKHMLNHDSWTGPFKDCNFSGLAFLRPVNDSKHFSGKVFTSEEFYDWKRKVCVLEHDYGNSMNGDTIIQACPPKEIYAEYRFWVVNGKIVTKSQYKVGDVVKYSDVVDNRFDNFVRARIKEWSPHKAFVIDVAQVPPNPFEQGRWAEDDIKIVEINTLNSSGFYAGDMMKLVMALEALESDQPMNPIADYTYSGDNAYVHWPILGADDGS